MCEKITFAISLIFYFYSLSPILKFHSCICPTSALNFFFSVFLPLNIFFPPLARMPLPYFSFPTKRNPPLSLSFLFCISPFQVKSFAFNLKLIFKSSQVCDFGLSLLFHSHFPAAPRTLL